MSPRDNRLARQALSQHALSQPAQRLYQWFSSHDPDSTVRYMHWDEMTVEQRTFWLQAVGAAFGEETR